MHPKSHAKRSRTLPGLVLLAGLTGAVAYGQPPAPPAEKDAAVGEVKVDSKTGALIIPVGGLVRFDPKNKNQPTDIQLSRDDVVQVRLDPNNPGVLLLTGRAPGLAQITLRFQAAPPQVFDVVVQPDYDLLRNLIRRTIPTANVEVTPGILNVVILSGYVTSPQDADVIAQLAATQVGGAANVVNGIQVGGVQQVQIDVVIASVDRNEIRSRGFDFAFNGRTTSFNSLVSGLLLPAMGVGGGPAMFGGDANLQLGITGANAGFSGALRALRTEGLAKFLAEPRVVTQTGRPAFFLAGGRQAVIGPASGINGPGVQFEQVGTQLEVLPIVYGNNQIWLEINPQVRTVNQGLGITTAFGATPGFTEQQARVAVMLESGQTFAIGGLIQHSVQASAARIPVLGDLPFVGTLFSRVNYEERESELVILVTPRLVHAMDCNQVPKRLPGMETRSADDYELFLEGILEAPRGQRKVWNGRCYNAAYKCDPTASTYPCVGNVCYGPNGTPLAGGRCGPAGCAPAGGVTVAGTVHATMYAAPVVAAPAAQVPAAMPSPPATLPVMADTPAPAGPVAPPGGVNVPALPPTTLPAVPGTPVGVGAEPGPLAPLSPAPEYPVAIPPAPGN